VSRQTAERIFKKGTGRGFQNQDPTVKKKETILSSMAKYSEQRKKKTSRKLEKRIKGAKSNRDKSSP